MDMFASVLRLDRSSMKALKITDVYSLHRAVYALFDDVRTEDQKQSHISSGIQWVDKGGNAFERRILILSNRRPKSYVQEEYGAVDTKLITSDFLDYSHYRFEVVINPTYRDKQSGKLIPIKGREAIADWFIQRATTQWGFTVNQPQLQIDAINVLTFNAKQHHPVTLQQAKLSGYFSVDDRDRFKTSFINGIGRGRSFGCGLLQIVPVLQPSYLA